MWLVAATLELLNTITVAAATVAALIATAVTTAIEIALDPTVQEHLAIMCPACQLAGPTSQH